MFCISRWIRSLPLDFPNRLCCPIQQMGSVPGRVGWLGLEIRRAMSPDSWMYLVQSHQIPGHSSQRHDRTPHPMIESAPGPRYPKSVTKQWQGKKCMSFYAMQMVFLWFTYIVTTRSSTTTSFVKKSAPIVALYWLENRLLTYWFIKEVFPTLLSPRMITFWRTFFRDAIFLKENMTKIPIRLMELWKYVDIRLKNKARKMRDWLFYLYVIDLNLYN